MTRLMTTLIVGTMLFIAACSEEGTMEKAGRQVDETIEKLQHGDEGTLEKAGRKIDEAIDEDEEDRKKSD